MAGKSAVSVFCPLIELISALFDNFAYHFFAKAISFCTGCFLLGSRRDGSSIEESYCMRAAMRAHSRGLRTGDELCWI